MLQRIISSPFPPLWTLLRWGDFTRPIWKSFHTTNQLAVFCCEAVAGSVTCYIILVNALSFPSCSCCPGIACSHKALVWKFCHRLCFLGNSKESNWKQEWDPQDWFLKLNCLSKSNRNSTAGGKCTVSNPGLQRHHELFFIAVVTNYHNLSDLKQHKCIHLFS